MRTQRVRAVLFACVASNAAFGLLGLSVLDRAVATPVAATQHLPNKHKTTETTLKKDTAPVDQVSAPTSVPPSTLVVPSSRTPRSTGTVTTNPAAAADDVTGITSTAAPPTVSRIAPDSGAYAASFSGSASVNGKNKSFPTTGTVVFTPTGGDLVQTAPKTPGDVQLTQRFSAAKAELVAFQLKAGDDVKRFTPAAPVTLLMFNAPTGTSWSWSATSTDGATHLSASGSVVGSSAVSVGAESVPVLQMTTTIKISGDVTGTAELTMWVSPTHRLPVMQRQVINAKAKAGLFTTRFASDITQSLTSLTPA